MATKKKPSIYDDRSTIGSSDELDEYGVWVKLEPHDLSGNPDPDESFADIGNFSGFSPDESIGGDVSFEDFNIPDSGEDAVFDDLEALRQDMQSPTQQAQPEPALPLSPQKAVKDGTADLSTQLLMKIAEELSSIKGELSNLKDELLEIRSEQPGKSAGEVADETEGAGFFDEEDDEKIALTGDELDNIIHTADFTEETGSDAGESLSDDFIAPVEFGENEEHTSLESPAGEILYDGLGRPINISASSEPEDTPEDTAPASTPGLGLDDYAGEILYDGLGRPLNSPISSSSDDSSAEGTQPAIDDSLELKDTDDLKSLRESGVEPMTPPPDDTSYLEEDPLAEEQIDLSDAIIDEPDLSEGIKESPLEEPSLDKLSLIDLDNIGDSDTPQAEDNFEDVSFDDLAEDGESIEISMFDDTASNNDLKSSDFVDISFDDPLPVTDTPAGDELVFDISDEDLSFEMINEDAELPIQENVQDNVITDDSFESISLDDDGTEPEAPEVEEGLEQALPEGMRIELDLPPLDLPTKEIDELFEEMELDDKNFDFPGAAVTADAGDLILNIADPGTEFPSSIKSELIHVLVYMDKLLESLPEDKIEEFAKSEHYNTYKKLFEELGIS